MVAANVSNISTFLVMSISSLVCKQRQNILTYYIYIRSPGYIECKPARWRCANPVPQSESPLKGLDTTLTNVCVYVSPSPWCLGASTFCRLSTTLASRIILNLRNPELQRLGRDTEPNLTSAWNTTTAGPEITVTTYDCTLTEDGTLPTDTQITEVARVV